jgi:quercetin dioxygenase-like cupin family protein
MISDASERSAPYVLVQVCEPEGCTTIGHVKPSQAEIVSVIEGEVGFGAGGETIVAGPGEQVVVGGATTQVAAIAS